VPLGSEQSKVAMLGCNGTMTDYWSPRKEHQFVAALLHAIGPMGLFAPVSSILVYTTRRHESRFLAVQALQAGLFQVTSLALLGATFLLFMIGFYYSAFSGMIAQTGVTNPELTNRLILAGIVGGGLIFFFQWLFPLVGLYAAVRVLLGANFKYPLIGRLAARWGAPDHQSALPKVGSASRHDASVTSDALLSPIAHILVVFGLAAVVNPVIWSFAGGAQPRVRFSLLQAAMFDLVVQGLLAFVFFGVFILTVLLGLFGQSIDPQGMRFLPIAGIDQYFDIAFFGLLAAIFIIARLLAVIAAISEFRGKRFRYPIIGPMLERYLTRLMS